MPRRPTIPPEQVFELPFGVNLIGHVSGNLGLGVAARNTLRMLEARGIPVAVVDIDAGGGRSGQDRTYEHLFHRGPEPAPFAINLFHVNPPDVPHLLHDPTRLFETAGRFNLVVPFWELPKLPRVGAWARVMAAMDMVLAPSRYVFDQVRQGVPDARINHYRQAVFLPDGIVADRARFGLAEDETIFFASFDLTGDVDRKNPWAAIEAFERAFPTGSRCRLLIKVNNPQADARLIPSAERLREFVAARSNVTLLETPLSYTGVLTLHASCDVLVSLHRAEGLGLNILEAMSLGRPVVATAFSGNMDFTTEENACLVPYSLVPVSSSHPAYGRAYAGAGQRWAEPDVDRAADCIARLGGDAELRSRIGGAAAMAMDDARERFMRSEWVEQVREWHSNPAALPGERLERQSRMARLAAVTRWMRYRRIIGGTLRKAGLRK